MKRFLLALSFLSIFPVGKRDYDEDAIRGSVVYFPVVGVLLAAILAVSTWALCIVLPSTLLGLQAIVVVAAMVAVHGALHTDGLADTADAFFSSREKARKLEIMKDSSNGTMAVVVLILLFIAKTEVLQTLAHEEWWRSVFLAVVSGRCALLWALALQPYARVEGGLGAWYFSATKPLHALWAFVCWLGCCTWVCAGNVELILSLLAVLVGLVFLWAWWCKKHIGGGTGDTVGALTEVTELAMLIAWAVLSVSVTQL